MDAVLPPHQQPQDAIDLTDNHIQTLGNFPLSPRIHTLLLARNRVASIQPNLPSSVPNLTNLVLASNSLAELADLDVLGKFPRLTQLVLMDNPVTKKEVGLCRGAARATLYSGTVKDHGSRKGALDC